MLNGKQIGRIIHQINKNIIQKPDITNRFTFRNKIVSFTEATYCFSDSTVGRLYNSGKPPFCK